MFIDEEEDWLNMLVDDTVDVNHQTTTSNKRLRNETYSNNNNNTLTTVSPLLLSSYRIPLEMMNNQIDQMTLAMKEILMYNTNEDKYSVLSILDTMEQRIHRLRDCISSTIVVNQSQVVADEMVDDYLDLNELFLSSNEDDPMMLIDIPSPNPSHPRISPTTMSTIVTTTQPQQLQFNNDALMMSDIVAYTFSFLKSDDYLNCLRVCRQWKEAAMNSPIALQTVAFPSPQKVAYEFVIQFFIKHVLYRLESLTSLYDIDPRVIHWLYSKELVLNNVYYLSMNERFLVSPKLLLMIKQCFPNLNRVSLQNVSKNCCDVTTLFSNLKEIDVVAQSSMFYNSPDIYESVHTLHLEIFQSTELGSLLTKFPNLRHLKLRTRPNDNLFEVSANAHCIIDFNVLSNQIEMLEIDQLSLETLPADVFKRFSKLKSIIVHTTTSTVDKLDMLDLLIKLNKDKIEKINYCNSPIPLKTYKTIYSNCNGLKELSCDLGSVSMKGLDKLVNLTSLDITANVPDELHCLESLTSLSQLTFSSTKINFTKLTKLKSFTLRNEKETLAIAIDSDTLVHIDIKNSRTTDAIIHANNLQSFVGCSALVNLKIQSEQLLEVTNISDAKRLTSVTILGDSKIQELDLLNKNDTAQKLNLKGCQRIKTLRASNKFALKALDQQSLSTSLRTLYLQDTSLSSQEFFGNMHHFSNLNSLSLVKCTFSGGSVAGGLKPCSTVRELNVSTCTSVPYQDMILTFPDVRSLKFHKLTQKSGGTLTQLSQILTNATNWPQLEKLVLCDTSYYLNQSRLQEIVSKRVGTLKELEIGFESQKGPTLSTFHISNSSTLERLVLNNCSFARLSKLKNLKSLSFSRFDKKKDLSSAKSVDQLVQQLKNTGANIEELDIKMEVSTTVCEYMVKVLLETIPQLRRIMLRNENFYDWSNAHTSSTYEQYSQDQLTCYQRLQNMCSASNVQCIFVDKSLDSSSTYL
jgi:hypothetical protein